MPYPSIQWMKQEPALQMVDCPAYELNRAVIEWAKKDFQPIPMSQLRASLSSLCRIDHFGMTLRKPELLQFYDDVRGNDKFLGLCSFGEPACVREKSVNGLMNAPNQS